MCYQEHIRCFFDKIVQLTKARLLNARGGRSDKVYRAGTGVPAAGGYGNTAAGGFTIRESSKGSNVCYGKTMKSDNKKLRYKYVAGNSLSFVSITDFATQSETLLYPRKDAAPKKLCLHILSLEHLVA